ncbi:MAG TPA: hypothetical protein VIX86_04575 [Streptosporangiaceae bacterium]
MNSIRDSQAETPVTARRIGVTRRGDTLTIYAGKHHIGVTDAEAADLVGLLARELGPALVADALRERKP